MMLGVGGIVSLLSDANLCGNCCAPNVGALRTLFPVLKQWAANWTRCFGVPLLAIGRQNALVIWRAYFCWAGASSWRFMLSQGGGHSCPGMRGVFGHDYTCPGTQGVRQVCSSGQGVGGVVSGAHASPLTHAMCSWAIGAAFVFCCFCASFCARYVAELGPFELVQFLVRPGPHGWRVGEKM